MFLAVFHLSLRSAVCVSVILKKIGPLPLAVQQQLLAELQQLLVALHQERRVIPADRLGTAEERGQGGEVEEAGKNRFK